MVVPHSMLVEIEEEEEFPPFGSQSSVDGLSILDRIFQKKGKKVPFTLWLRRQRCLLLLLLWCWAAEERVAHQ